MPVTACPATVIEAPVARVWALLVDPQQWGVWTDAHFVVARPAGPTRAGQRWLFVTTGLGRRWPVKMTVTSVATAPYRLGVDIATPLGIRNEEIITLARLAEDRTRVQFA